jgi:RibD C-terminal domain
MGGGELAQSLLAAGLLDEIGLNIHPILLGSGIPLFRDPGHRVQLMLSECRPIEGGCILASYRVLHGECGRVECAMQKNGAVLEQVLHQELLVGGSLGGRGFASRHKTGYGGGA